MMKHAILYSLVLLTSLQSSKADQLPEDAKKIVERLIAFEDKKISEMNKFILKEKKDAVKSLKKIRKDLDKPQYKWAVGLIDVQLAKYKKEIAQLERDEE